MTSDPAGDGDPVAAWRALLLAQSRAVRAIEEDLDRADVIPLTWYDVLLELNAAPERRLTMGELGAVAVVSRSRVSRVVDELVKAGLVAREANPDDRRSAFAAITPAGRRRLRSAAPTYLAGIQRLFADRMTTKEAQTVADALGKVLSG